MANYKITSRTKFSQVVDIDLEGIKYRNGHGMFVGDVSIDDGNGWADISGEFGASDFEDEYGFIIVND